jgi:LPXTG-motif cell wall-anchored protein
VTQPTTTTGSPTTTTTPQPVTQPTSSSPGGSGPGGAQPTAAAATMPTTKSTPQIAFTGANTETTAGIGMGLLALGGGLVLVARRRRVGRVAADE